MVVPHGVVALPRNLTTGRPTSQWHTGIVVIGDSPEGLVTAAELIAAGVPTTVLSSGFPGQAPDRDIDTGLLVPEPGAIAPTAADAHSSADPTPHGSPTAEDFPGPAAQDLLNTDPDGLRTAEACQQLATEAARLPDWLDQCHIQVHLEPTEWPHWRRVTRSGHTLAADISTRMLARLRIAALDDPARCRLINQATLVDLLTDDNDRVCGVRCLTAAGDLVDYLASAVVLADGGLGPGWPEQPLPASYCLAAALRTGAVLSDLEFLSRVELAVPPKGFDLPGMPAIVLPESTGGEVDWDQWPRVTRLLRQYGVPVDRGLARRPGWRLRSGGAMVDADGRTTLAGLWAVGGCATGEALGADPSPALARTQAFVDARRCASAILAAGPRPAGTPPAPDTASAPVAERAWQSQAATISQALTTPRDHTRLRACLADLARLPWSGAVTPRDLAATSQLVTAAAVLAAAVARPESRGPHQRADHPEADPRWRGRHVQVRVDVGGAMHVRVTPAVTVK